MKTWRQMNKEHRDKRRAPASDDQAKPKAGPKKRNVRLERRPRPGTRAYRLEVDFWKWDREKWSKHGMYTDAQTAERVARLEWRRHGYWQDFDFRIVMPDGEIREIPYK